MMIYVEGLINHRMIDGKITTQIQITGFENIQILSGYIKENDN
jgi:hypothetical protein